MLRNHSSRVSFACLCLAVSLGAAPAAPSYHGVERAAGEMRRIWAEAQPGAEPHASGWESFLQDLSNELKAYASATTPEDRLRSLDRVAQLDAALATVAWQPAINIRAELANWTRPRRQIVEADRQLRAFVASLGEQSNEANRSHAQGWVRFVDDGIGGAIREYERANTVAARSDALRRLRSDLLKLIQSNSQQPWGPALTYQEAVRSAFSHSNLDVTADANTLAPFLAQQIVNNEVIYRSGYYSYVTAGPYTGFGLMDSDDGIVFFNRQMASTVTPITDFHQQVAQDRQGRRAARLYHFSATSYNNPEVIAIAAIKTTGLVLLPGSTPAVSAAFNSMPIAGRGFGRAIASLIGFGPRRITQQVAEGAFDQVEQGVIQGATDEANERAAEKAAQINGQVRQFLVGNNTLMVNPLAVVNLSLRSRSQFALIEGTATWNDLAGEALGADAPQPSQLLAPNQGISADVHLTSILSSMARGFLETGPGRDVENVLIVTSDKPEGTPLNERIAAVPNATGQAFVDAANNRQPNNQAEQAVRVYKPERPPEFAVDADGNLVALIRDFQVDLAAQRNQLYRVTSPLLEVRANFDLKYDEQTGQTKVAARLVDVNFGPRARVAQLAQDGETVAQQIPLGTFVLNLITGAARNREFELPVPTEQLRGFRLAAITPMDPSGWVRVVLAR